MKLYLLDKRGQHPKSDFNIGNRGTSAEQNMVIQVAQKYFSKSNPVTLDTPNTNLSLIKPLLYKQFYKKFLEDKFGNRIGINGRPQGTPFGIVKRILDDIFNIAVIDDIHQQTKPQQPRFRDAFEQHMRALRN